jgi:hypothetical protein
MKSFTRITQMLVGMAMLAVPAFASAQSKASHVDFDDQLIQGQVNKGAVHLIERKDSDLGSLVKVRKNYRKEILAGVEGEPTLPAPTAVALESTPAAAPSRSSEPARAVPATKPASPPATKPGAPKSAAKPAGKGQSASVKIGGSRAISRR